MSEPIDQRTPRDAAIENEERALDGKMMSRDEIIAALVAVARAAWIVGDGTEDHDGKLTIVFREDFNRLSDALDKLDELPNWPMVDAEGPAKAEHWLECVPIEPREILAAVRQHSRAMESAFSHAFPGISGFILKRLIEGVELSMIAGIEIHANLIASGKTLDLAALKQARKQKGGE